AQRAETLVGVPCWTGGVCARMLSKRLDVGSRKFHHATLERWTRERARDQGPGSGPLGSVRQDSKLRDGCAPTPPHRHNERTCFVEGTLPDFHLICLGGQTHACLPLRPEIAPSPIHGSFHRPAAKSLTT